MLPQQYCLRWKYHHSNLQTMFSQLLDRGCFCDVTLACEGQMIRAHRVVLCACSTFFDNVLTNFASDREPIIIMKDVTFVDIKSLIEFMYKGEINVEHANLTSLLKTADELKIKGLAEVSVRDDEDGHPLPTPATELLSPTRIPEAHIHKQRRASFNRLDRNGRRSMSPKVDVLNPGIPPFTPLMGAVAVNSTFPVSAEHHLGPKRKRGRPPLDDAYDVFNIRKMAHYGSHMDHHAYLEAQHYEDERRPPPGVAGLSDTAVAAVAYQQHIHQQQSKHRMRHRRQHSEVEEPEQESGHTDAEWINSNLEVNVSESEPTAEHKIEQSTPENAQHGADVSVEMSTRNSSTNAPEPCSEVKSCEPPRAKKDNHSYLPKKLKVEDNMQSEIEQDEPTATVPQPVEEIENQQQIQDQQAPVSLITTVAVSTPTTVHTTVPNNSSSANKTPPLAHISAPVPPPPPMHSLHHAHFGKYGPEGYLVNEHGMLMTHDFVHAPIATVPTSSSASSSSADQEMNEEYDGTDLRLTREEMSEWQDVIKMDDYLATGRRPHFWEEPFTKRVLDAIKKKKIEMKKAASLLGVSYGTLYGRYREVYGCLKHPYNNITFRLPQSNSLALQPRYDAAPLVPLEIGKVNKGEIGDMWARPQI